MPLPAALDARTADLVVDMSPDGTFFDRWDPKTSLGPRAFGNPPDCNDPAHCMTDDVPARDHPAANLHANARGLDRCYACWLGGTAGARPGAAASSTSSAAATCAATTR